MIGKDGRQLSSFQGKKWMIQIGKNRKYKNQAKGEKSGVAKLKEWEILYIRRNPHHCFMRTLALHHNISIRHVYNIRARKAWKHL